MCVLTCICSHDANAHTCICLCACVHMCANVYVCVYLCVCVHEYVNVHVCAYGGQRWQLSVFLNSSSPHFLRWGLSLSPDLATWLDCLAS